ncbi:MAG: signal peptidase II [Candidatus Sumerlaeia bacterium]|nr:signal peptidase II [Candidatus Sumerlaeia bacterium]
MYFYLAGLVILLLDQISKQLATRYLQSVENIVIIPGFFHLMYATNTGGAFSILSDHSAILAIFSTVATILIFAWQFIIPRSDWVMLSALGMIFGGAVGNLIDRFRLGYVVDFLDFHWRNKLHWPTFNFADTFICIGVGVIICCTLFPQFHQKLIGKSLIKPDRCKD